MSGSFSVLSIKPPPPLMLEKQTVYEYFPSIKSFYRKIWQKILTGAWEMFRDSMQWWCVGWSWSEVRGVSWEVRVGHSVLTRLRPVNNYQSRSGVWSYSSPVCRPQSDHWNQFRGCHRPTARWWTLMVAIITPEHQNIHHQSTAVQSAIFSETGSRLFQVVLHFSFKYALAELIRFYTLYSSVSQMKTFQRKLSDNNKLWESEDDLEENSPAFSSSTLY